MKTPMEVFKTHFEQGMVVRDFEAFKRQYPTLLKVIIKSMEDYAGQQTYREPEGRKTETYVRVPGGGRDK